MLQTILSQLAPYECLGCAAEGRLICDSCAAAIVPLPPRCYRCQRISSGHRTCQSCRSSSDLCVVWVAAAYTGIAKELIWQLKSSGAQPAAKEMAQLFNHDLPDDIVFVSVPTASSRIRQRGYDQARLFAKALSRRYGMPHLPVLRRTGQQHQVGATRQQRISQLTDAYRCTNQRVITGRHVVLVDDVLTTGSTLEAATKVMKAAGAARVSGIVFAQA